jgi:DNA-directed RNA polymerase alpha subunit
MARANVVTAKLADDVLLKDVELSTRIRNALRDAGFKTVGDVRDTSDASLLSLQNMGDKSVAVLRVALG